MLLWETKPFPIHRKNLVESLFIESGKFLRRVSNKIPIFFCKAEWSQGAEEDPVGSDANIFTNDLFRIGQ